MKIKTNKIILLLSIVFFNFLLTNTASAIVAVPSFGIGAVTHNSANTSCNDIRRGGGTDDGTYMIDLINDGGNSFEVYCEMTTDGGGWTLVSLGSTATAGAGVTVLTSLRDSGGTPDGNPNTGDYSMGTDTITAFINAFEGPFEVGVAGVDNADNSDTNQPGGFFSWEISRFNKEHFILPPTDANLLMELTAPCNNLATPATSKSIVDGVVIPKRRDINNNIRVCHHSQELPVHQLGGLRGSRWYGSSPDGLWRKSGPSAVYEADSFVYIRE